MTAAPLGPSHPSFCLTFTTRGSPSSLSMMAWRSKRPRPKNSIGPSARALPSVATDITMSPSYLHLRHSVPVPSSTTFAAPLPGNSLRRARVPLVSLTVLICLISSSLFSLFTALSRFPFSRPPRTPSKKSSCKAAIDRLATWKDFSTSHLNHTKLLQTSTPELSSSPSASPSCELSGWPLRTSMLSKLLFAKNSYASRCLRPWTLFTLKFLPSCALMLPVALVAHKTYTHLILVRLPPVVWSSPNELLPALRSLHNSAVGSHEGSPPTWRWSASNVIPLRGPAPMLMAPVAISLWAFRPAISSNLRSLLTVKISKLTQPPTLLLLSTSHPPLATKAASVRNFQQNKRTLVLPTSPALPVSCSHFSFALSSGRAIPQTNFTRLGSPSFPVKTPWRKPWSFHLSQWNTVFTCRSLPFVAFSPSSCVCRFIANQTHWAGPTSTRRSLRLHHPAQRPSSRCTIFWSCCLTSCPHQCKASSHLFVSLAPIFMSWPLLDTFKVRAFSLGHARMPWTPPMTGHWNGISALHRATPVLLLSSTLTRTAGNSWSPLAAIFLRGSLPLC